MRIVGKTSNIIVKLEFNNKLNNLIYLFMIRIKNYYYISNILHDLQFYFIILKTYYFTFNNNNIIYIYLNATNCAVDTYICSNCYITRVFKKKQTNVKKIINND